MRPALWAVCALCALPALLAGCFSPCNCGDSDPRQCEPSPLMEDTFPALYDGEEDCVGAETGACWKDAKLTIEDNEIVLRWTDADGARWEASWVRLPEGEEPENTL